MVLGKLNIKRMMLILLLGLFLLDATTSAQFMGRRRRTRKKTENVPVEFQLKPVFAQFLSSNFVLKGDETGIYSIDIQKPGVTEPVLTGVGVTTMMSVNGDSRGVIVATDTGQIYFAGEKEGKAELTQLSGISADQAKIIDSILINPSNSDQIALMNSNEMFICNRSGSDLTDVYSIKNPNPEKPFNFLVSDHQDDNYFIVDASNKGRYRSNWLTKELKEIPDGTMPHGYKVSRGSVTYIPIGENGQYLLTRYISAVPTLLKKFQSKTRTYLCATIGSSPMIITIDQSNFYKLRYLSRDHLTFSIDYDSENDKQLLYTTSDAVKLTVNSGRTWKKID